MDPQNFWSNGTAASPAPATETTVVSQPGAAGAPGVSNEAPPQESEVNYQERARQLEADLDAQRTEAERLRGTMQQVQHWAEQTSAQQQEQQFQAGLHQHEQEIYRRAENMAPAEAYSYIQQENAKIRQALMDRTNQVQQYAQQQIQQVQRTAATPLYIDHIAKTNGLSEEAKQELIAYGDPDIAARQAPIVKQRYDQIANLQDQLNQLSRSRQAGQLQASGVGMVGGTGVQNVPTDLSADPDIKAMQIYAQLKNGTYTPS